MAGLRRKEWKTPVEVDRARAVEVELAKAVGQARFFRARVFFCMAPIVPVFYLSFRIIWKKAISTSLTLETCTIRSYNAAAIYQVSYAR